jgi:membrane protein DedA with SNARE-associated domain
MGSHFLEPFLKKRGHFFSVTPELFEKGKKLFERYNEKILLISKMTLGFGMAIVILMVAGATKVPFKTYLFINIIGEIFLVAVLLFIGYFLGNVYPYIADGFKTMFLFGSILIAGFAMYGFSRYVKSLFRI